MSTIVAARSIAVRQMGIFDRVARRLMFERLGGLSRGEIELEEANESTRLGSGGDLQVLLRVNDSRFFRRAVTRRSTFGRRGVPAR